MKTESQKIAEKIAKRVKKDYYWEDGGFIDEWFMEDLRNYGASILNQLQPTQEGK